MRRQRIYTFITFLVAILVIVLFSMLYITQISHAIWKNSIANIKELTLHDINQTQITLDRTWAELESVVDRVQSYRCKTTLEVLERLTLERHSSSFYSIYLVSADGAIYTDALITMERDKQHIYAFFEQYAEKNFCVRYTDIEGISELRKSTLLYGVHIEPLLIDGVTYIGIVGLKKLSDIQTQMRIESFNGQGHANIVNLFGQYIASPRLLGGINNNENFFDNLRSTKILEGLEIEKIKRCMEQKESIFFNIIKSSGERQVVYIYPLSKVSWYFVYVVDYDVFQNQSRYFITTSAFMLFVTLAIIGVLLVLLIHARQKTVESLAVGKARSEFLSSMSHEIRTPLNGLIGLNHLMTIHLDRSDLLKDYLQKSTETANYLLSLVNDILDMSKLQAGKVTLLRDNVDLLALVTKVRDMQTNNMKSRGINFEVDTYEIATSCRYIVTDNTRLTQVIMNLLSNAAKFTPRGGFVTLKAKTTLFNSATSKVQSLFATKSGEGEEIPEEGLLDQSSASADKPKVSSTSREQVYVTFSVADTGCGISEDFKAHLFESFSQDPLNNFNRNAALNGTGLGLSISNQIVRLMGGSIKVDSVLGKGSTFVVTFPTVTAIGRNTTGFVLDTDSLEGAESSTSPKNNLKEKPLDNASLSTASELTAANFVKQGASTSESATKPEQKDSSPSNGFYASELGIRMHILIAEDNDLNAQIFNDILEANGYYCTRASDGFEVVSIFNNSEIDEFDAILMDVQMPRMNGYEAATAIRNLDRADSKQIPIFACTANTFSEDRDKAFQAGMNGFLSKPIDIEEMLQKLRMI